MMSIVKNFVVAALAIAATSIFADAGEWDFTKGTAPAGGELRGVAQLTAKGITVADISDWKNKGGFQLKKKFAYPDAFRFEADLVLHTAKGAKSSEGAIWDDMYVTRGKGAKPCGMQVAIHRYHRTWTPVFYLGVGGRTCIVRGPSVIADSGKSVKLVAEYDANRRLNVEFDGAHEECILSATGPISPSTYPTIVGNRVGGNYYHAEAVVSRVAVSPLKREALAVFTEGRTAFERAEKDATLTYSVENFSSIDITELKAQLTQVDSDGVVIKRTDVDFGTLKAGAIAKNSVVIESRVRTGESELRVQLEGKGNGAETVKAFGRFKIGIGPTFAERMPTVMWGFNAPRKTVADYGFTHATDYIGFRGPLVAGTDAHAPVRRLDDALLSGLRLMKSMGMYYPSDEASGKYYRKPKEELAKKLEAEKRNTPQAEVGHPAMVDWVRKTARADLQVFGEHPAFGGVLAVSEKRETGYPSLNTDAARFKKETGLDIPPEVQNKTLDFKIAKKRFPDGIVPEDDPLYIFYRWYWHGGDGWPNYFTAIANEYRSVRGRYGDGSDIQRKSPFFSFHDPAVRQPAIWGNGGDLDVLSQWCYATPEPMNVAGPAEELFAMAEGNPGQQVMIMTQIICYRVHLAPKNVKVDPAPEWVKRRPEAAFPTIPPDVLQEATWSMLAKPVRGIMYHGWNCIYETGEEKGYTYTNAETEKRIKSLLHDVVAPLGPSLLKIGRERNQVAVLESGVSAMLGGPASWGWMAPAITFLQRARLDPRVVYEEAVLKGALDDVKILYAPQFCMTTKPVIEAIKKFQQRGGILVGDEQMLKALKPDICVPIVKFFAPPTSDHTEDIEAMDNSRGSDTKSRSATVNAKRIMQSQAEDLRKALAAKGYVPGSDSSSSELVVYNRKWKDTPYIFAINDKRTFGDYVGQWGRIMEKGLPFEGEVFLRGGAKRTAAVYELSRGGRLPHRKVGEDVAVALKYGTNDGRLLTFLDEEIAAVKIKSPLEVAPGGRIALEFKVLGKSGRPIAAVLPVEIRLYDSSGREIDGAGFAAAEGGVCRMEIPVNMNDAPGEYRLVCRDRASGLVAESRIFRGRLPWWKKVWRKIAR